MASPDDPRPDQQQNDGPVGARGRRWRGLSHRVRRRLDVGVRGAIHHRASETYKPRAFPMTTQRFRVTRRLHWGETDPAAIIYGPQAFTIAIECIEEMLIATTGLSFRDVNL